MAISRNIDPTQVGTSGLSGINTKEGARRYFESLGFSESLPEYKIEKSTRPVEMPVQEIGRVGVGDSRLDKRITSLTQLEDIEDTRADLQHWTSKIGSGIGKGVVLAGTTFLDGIAGTVIGAVNGFSNIGSSDDLNGWQEYWSGFWNNPFSQAMQQINDWSEQIMPNYMSKEERDNIANGEGYKNMFTANWWGNSFLKNLGFSVGAFATGNIVSSALRGATPLVKTIAGSAISAINEGKVEALNNSDEWYESEMSKLNAAYENELAELEQNYGSSEIYQSLVNNARNVYNEAVSKLNADKAKVGNVTLALNIPILTASNWFMWGKLYSGGAKTAMTNTSIAKRNGKYVTNAGFKAITGPLSEGAEEMEQKIATTIPQIKYSSDIENFYSMRFSPNESREAIDWTKATMQGISDVVGDKNSWEEFVIGAMSGALGMPSFRGMRNESGKRQIPITMQGGLWEALDDVKREKSMVTELNSRVSDPKFTEYYQGLVRHNKYQNDMDNAALNGDMFQYKNAEDSQLISDIVLFANAGRLQDVEQMVNESFDTSNENIARIVEYTTDSNGNGPFSVDGNVKPTNYIVESLEEQKNNILNAINNYRETKDYINSMLASSDRELSNPELEELIWLKSKSNAWNDRFNQLSDEVRQKFRTIAAGYKIHYPDKTDIIENALRLVELNNESLQATMSSKDNKDIVRNLTAVSNSLSKSYNLDWRDLGQDIKDLTLLAEYKNKADEKLASYMLNIDKLKADLNESKSKVDNKNAQEDRKEAVNKLNSVSNYGEIASLLESGEVAVSDIDKSSSDIVKSYDKSNLFRKKANDYIDSFMPDKYKEIAREALTGRYNNSSSYSDLVNTGLKTNYGINYSLMDTKTQEDFEHKFNTMLKEVDSKISAGDNIKSDVKVKNTSAVGNPVGRDEIPQVPESSDSFNEDHIKDIINKSSLMEDSKKEMLESVGKIKEELTSYKDTKNPNSARHIKSIINSLIEQYNNDEFVSALNSISRLVKTDNFNPGTANDVASDNSEDSETYPETAVTGVMKAAIPQFDLTAKKYGKLIDFYIEGENRNVNYAYIYNKLKETGSDGKNAFEYVNEGNVKEGDSLEVRYEEASDVHPEIFWLYHNNHLVNALAPNETEESETIKKNAKEGKNPKVTVTKIMDGKFSYTRDINRPVKDIINDGNVKIGIMKNGRMVANTDEIIDPVFDSSNADGKVYILLPNSRGTLSPKNIQIVHFNALEFNLNAISNNNPIANDVRNILIKLTELSDKPTEKLEVELDKIYLDMIETFYIPDSFHIDTYTKMNGDSYLRIGYNDRNGSRVNKNILIKSEPTKGISLFGEPRNSESKSINPNELYDNIRTALQDANLAFNVNAKNLIGKKSSEYVNRLVQSDVLRTYLTSNRMQGTWFLLNEKPDSHQSSDSFEAYKAERDAKNSIRVKIDSREYSVINDIVYTQDGKVAKIDESYERLIKDLANIQSTYGNSRYGVNQHAGKVLIEDKHGKRAIDRATSKYLDSEQLEELEASLSKRKPNSDKSKIALKNFLQSQKNVRRTEDGNPKTDTGYYEILEDDGQYHQYERVHSVIGSNWLGESKSSEATSYGSMIDDLVRQFFTDASKIKKPDNMSSTAYNNLMRALGSFKAEADTNGLQIITDRLVVYHKYPNGKRIAGELDMLSYNPFTGNVSIIDTKTSKYSTKTKNFVVPTDKQTRSTKDQYTLQLSAYAKLFEDSFDFPISKLTLLPFNISYSDDSLKILKPEDLIRLSYNKNVFEGKIPVKMLDGQYTTTSNGEIKFHKVKMRPISGKENNMYYLSEDNRKLIHSNGRSMTLPEGFITDDMSSADIVMKLVEEQESLNRLASAESYLQNSPYGNSVIVTSESKPVSKGIEAANILNSLKPSGSAARLSVDNEVMSNRPKVKIDPSTSIGREMLSKKSWNALTENEKSIIMASFEGISESDVQAYWDGVDSIQREKIIACP